MERGQAPHRLRVALFTAAAGMSLLVAGPAAAEEPSVTPPAGPAGLTTPSAEAPADSNPEQSGPSASQAARNNVRELPGPRSDGGISGGLLAACLLAVVAGVAAAASGAQRRRAAL